MSDHSRLLRTALSANALFSTTCAAILLAAPASVAEWLGAAVPAWLLQGLGVGLLIFAGELLWQASRTPMILWRARAASLADFLWVVGSAVLLLVLPGTFSTLGVALIVDVAAVVLCCGLAQWFGARRIERGGERVARGVSA